MLKKLTNLEIQDITGDIEMGLSVYIHKENHNLISIHDDYDPMMTGEEDPDFDEIQENRDDYFCIEKMGSSEGFRVMSGFAKNIKNRKTREKLFEILERRSPFRNFRAEVESDPKYRTDWFVTDHYKGHFMLENSYPNILN